eukprot:TRINITY_DN28123_c0_g1_i1.p1 TRINITY_DN28123_c0_g1~~TRINITY_DN28123_c0_g1_i1.p1  ORF type:complete len:444 (+),score=118.83 TRINITY_DN28123_c0_g1_i1:38-1369(+)
MKALDPSKATVRYGANGRRSCQLHGLFYCLVGRKGLVYRSETTDSVGLPHCPACGNEYSKKALEQVKGACGVCCHCPYCHAKLGTGEEAGSVYYACSNCHYSTKGVLACERGESEMDDLEALGNLLIEAERTVDLEEEFRRIQKDLQACFKQYTLPVRERLGDAAVLLEHGGRRGADVGGHAMGLSAQRLAEFEAKLGEKKRAVMATTDAAPATTPAGELAVAPISPRSKGLYKDPNSPMHAAKKGSGGSSGAGEDGVRLPVRVALVVRHAVRYNKSLLATEMGQDGTRRLNRSAPTLLPRVFISNPLPNAAAAGQPFPVILTFINPTSAPIAIAELPAASTYLCSCATPAADSPLTIGAKPETESQRYIHVDVDPAAPAKARVVDAWDNVLQVQLVVTPETLPEQHAPREGLGVTLRVLYRHTIDAEELSTPLFIFLAFPFK